ncbi:MAG TPA: phytanoyl-CoA dioxygenase family protein [Capsulimonadaceae bacterium]|jgi:ectoine hydroxylase-related dioxygenase (phytanoyl-CoA dioxygenase family)
MAKSAPYKNSMRLLEFDDRDALVARAERDGYLFFRNVLPAGDVNAVRADILRVVDRYGWRTAGQDSLGGHMDVAAINRVADEQMRLDIGVSAAAYDDVQRLESVHALPHNPRLIALFERLFNTEVLVHPRHIIRMMTPHRSLVPTPPHQDFPLIQGTPATWTCWFPLGDCPRDLGSLTVLRGSHKRGYLPVSSAAGAGNIAVQLCHTETDWVSGDFEVGDILTFPSYTVHKALPNKHPEQIRLSMDVRYQAADDVIEEKSLLPHCALTWDEIYRDWSSEELQYYWRKYALERSEWNPDLFKPGRRIC